MVGRMSGRGNAVGRNVQSWKSSSGKCPVRQVSVEELSFEEVSDGELSRYQFISETFSEELL